MGVIGLFLFLIPHQIQDVKASCSTTLTSVVSATAKADEKKKTRIAEAWDAYLKSRSKSVRQESRNILWEHYFIDLYQKMRPRFSFKKLHPSLTEDDLKSEFALALLKCLEKYDPSSNTKFETFCSTPLAFSISNLKRFHKPLGSRGSARRVKVYQEAVFNLKAQGKHPPTEEELLQEVTVQLAAKYTFADAEALEKEAKLTVLHGHGETVLSLDDELFKTETGKTINDPGYDPSFEEEIDLEDFLSTLLEGFPIRDQIIVRLLIEGYGQSEIAAELNRRGTELIMNGASMRMNGTKENGSQNQSDEERLNKAATSLKKSSATTLDQRDWLLLTLRQFDLIADGSTSRLHDNAEFYLDPGEAMNLEAFIKTLSEDFTDRNQLIIRLALKGKSATKILAGIKAEGFRAPRLSIDKIIKQEIMPHLERRLESYKLDHEIQRMGFNVSQSRISQILTKEIAPKLEERLKQMDSRLFQRIGKVSPQ